MGHDAFRRGMVAYFKKFAWQNVTVYDFLDTLQVETEFNLRLWVEEWVQEAGMNSIKIEWEVQDGLISQAVAYQQITSGRILRNHHLLVEAVSEEGTIFKEKVSIPNVSEYVVTELIGKPAPKGIIVNSEDHAYVEVLIDSKSLDFFFKSQQISSISLINRGVLWLSIWAKVEEQLLPATIFLDLACQILPSETSDEVTDIILGYALKASTDYLTYDLISTYSHSMVQTIKVRLTQNPNDKNLRKIYSERKLFSFLFSNEDIREAYQWSFALGRSELWRGLMHMASIVSFEEISELIKEETKYDRSDNALKLKFYCEAAAFDNKKASWELILNREDLSLSQLEYLMKGFNQFNQREVLSEYAEQYFEYLPSIFESQDREYAESFFRYLLPKYENTEVIIEKLLKINTRQKWVSRIIEETIDLLRKDNLCQMVVKRQQEDILNTL